jgi:ubiquinone/menaquinone biosynthesis C-methylase UbiE
MKIHVGCGQTILPGFINIDNSPTALLSKLPMPVLSLFSKWSLVNSDQALFARTLKERKGEFLYCSCYKLPFKDKSVDFAYSSHMLGWYLGPDQLHRFLQELSRVLRPGGGARLSFFDLDKVLSDYQQHRDTFRLMQQLPTGAGISGFRGKLKFLFSPSMQVGIPLNAGFFDRYLREHGFRDIRTLEAGATTMEPQWVEGLDLSQREGESVYMECRKEG